MIVIGLGKTFYAFIGGYIGIHVGAKVERRRADLLLIEIHMLLFSLCIRLGYGLMQIFLGSRLLIGGDVLIIVEISSYRGVYDRLVGILHSYHPIA